MSLLNDALKKAQQGQVRGGNDDAADSPLEPAVEAKARQGISKQGAAVVVLLAFCCLGFWWTQTGQVTQVTWTSGAGSGAPVRGKNAASTPSQLTSPVEEVVGRAGESPEEQPGRALAVALSQALPAQINTPAPERQPDIRTNSVPPSTVPESSAAPAFRLDAIHYRLTRPSVVLNGRTLFVGSDINGAKVVSIERQAVRIQIHGKILVLDKH